MANKKITLGQPVTYIGSKGLPKLALVVGTPETVEPGHSLPTLEEGQLHLVVWEFSEGHFVPKMNVRSFETVEKPEEGDPIRYWKLA